MESLADAGGDPRALLTVAGRTIVRHQLECALALGCEKIACQAPGLSREMLDLQHLAEGSGAQFQVLTGSRVLSGMVRAADELLVFADGLLPECQLAQKLLADRPAVLVLPADEGIAAGFERIDRDYAWAGLFMVRGAAVERLADLPPDADPVASLLRIALQTGTRIAAMPEGALARHEWGLVHSADHADRYEQAWLDRHMRPAPLVAPLLAAADWTATSLIRRAHGGRLSGGGILGGAAALAGLAALTGWFWEPVAGFALLAAAYFAARTGGALKSLESPGRPAPEALSRTYGWLVMALDIVLIALSAMAGPQGEFTTVLAATSLILALRIGGALPLGNWKILFADRSLLVIALAIAAYFGQITLVSQILTVSALAVILIDAGRSKLTRT
ncbi:hypothetical protein [Allopontixanthobacter sp.]|uniref:hypothetical protein n=1 Tax=Allopontixanthobacter sp. TaxID=2906452 RepID=UPI002AB957B4|nr:hypothetical protein [Allopontixanthobacter sp.]MDZ4308586.1 hypothetical protein [Allopontixanthobacter sp.]